MCRRNSYYAGHDEHVMRWGLMPDDFYMSTYHQPAGVTDWPIILFDYVEGNKCHVRRVLGNMSSGVLFAVRYEGWDRFFLLKEGDWIFFGDHDEDPAIARALEDYIISS